MTLPAVIRLWTFCAAGGWLPTNPDHTHTHTHTTACPLAVNHALTGRTGDRPVIKPWCYHSSSHLYSPPPYTSLSLAFTLFLSLNNHSLLLLLCVVLRGFFSLSKLLPPFFLLLNTLLDLCLCTNTGCVGLIVLNHRFTASLHSLILPD